MALTLRGDGTGAAFQVSSAWWNDYYNLLTGVMTDQPVSLVYNPGTTTSTPTLKLTANGNAPLLTAYVSGVLKLQVTSGGNLQDGSAHYYTVMVGSGATAGRQIFVGPTTPTGANEGDIWIKA